MDFVTFLSLCIATPLSLGFLVWAQLAAPDNDGVPYACAPVGCLIYVGVYRCIAWASRTRHPLRLGLALFVLSVAVPSWWLTQAQWTWGRSDVFYEPLDLFASAIGILAASGALVVVVCLWCTTVWFMCCSCCCACDPYNARVSCCNWGGSVDQSRRRRRFKHVWQDGSLVSSEEIYDGDDDDDDEQ